MSFISKFLTQLSDQSTAVVLSDQTNPLHNDENDVVSNPEITNIFSAVKPVTAEADHSAQTESDLTLGPPFVQVEPDSTESFAFRTVGSDTTEQPVITTAVQEAPRERVTIASYFADKGIELTLPTGKQAIAPVESLAFYIALSYPQTKTFIRYIRDRITQKCYEFTYPIGSYTPADRGAISSLCDKLCEYGLISDYFYNKANNTIRGVISSAPRAVNFINGDFLELYAKSVTIGVIKAAAGKRRTDYEFYHNVNITKDNEKHELDIVFRVGDQVFWSEIKSGRFNPDEYRKLGIFMGVVPDKFIMLAADKSNDAANSIAYFYEYYCANINTFKSTITQMIDKAFSEEDEQ